MKVFLTTLLALFPMFHEKPYEATYQSCSSEGIFLRVEDEVKEVKLFNVTLQEAGQQRVCERLKKAKKIIIEIDTSSKTEEPLPVYVFVDGSLLQEEVLKNKEAYITIRNPEYRYFKKMDEAAKSQATMASTKEDQTKQTHTPSKGYRYLLFFICIWFVLGYLILRPKLQKRKENTDE